MRIFKQLVFFLAVARGPAEPQLLAQRQFVEVGPPLLGAKRAVLISLSSAECVRSSANRLVPSSSWRSRSMETI